jgi:DNA-binding transcriptional ArsR family regulator
MLVDFISIAKALSDETRVRILKLLEEGELCVCELMEILGMGQSTVSKHLGILRTAGLVRARKEGTWSFYRLTDEAVNKYNLIFKELMAAVLNDDKTLLEDLKRLRALKKGAKLCKIVPSRTNELTAK